ncbi:hypothetical protein [endosymbiont of Ridgeia piscesae]|jgi:hypothetical protein|uniref:Uncharacterized protein n=1 Tax=endosymbiont of Ridgeia piscesae TaxID=54398 RepID=A0A0T5YYZ4_9GAMM|nr:hypothetical protein [endosymbiont of Ridgeia piscesae]KRT55858.1 hypothetical protein Ga0074115_1267 [endosymbiont of Ridgeia piscesae]KRT59647.1 hypothetical protein Ga0076813_15864 [endosymbiont of Ridgeia piscesae]
MSTPSRFIAESLEELLVSIADGVREAQDALNSAPPLDRFGRPLPSYHLPYLDFQLQAAMETVSSNSGAVRLRIIPLNGSNTATQEISSTLSGRLVAVPPGEGLPTPILSLSSTRENARRHTIRVTASNSAGEILVGQTIELNLNMEASKQLSLIQGITLTSQRAGTRLADALLVTDETGSAETRFDIDPGIPAKAVLVVSAELGSEVAHLSLPAGGGA